MKHFGKRAAALGLALLITAGSTLALASDAMGTELHKGYLPLSQGTQLGKEIFWSDTYSDLRTEHYVTYTPNSAVVPTVSYGDKIISRATLSSMAKSLEGQGKRVVSGINGDYYVMATGAPVGMVIQGGELKSTPPYKLSYAVGFRADGTAFIGTPNLSVTATFGGQSMYITGGVNKVRKITEADGTGGLTLLTSDFASTTQNTKPGVDVILTPVDDGSGNTKIAIGRTVTCTVDQVLESSTAVAIPQGKFVLTMNGTDKAEILAKLRALQPGEQVTLSATSPDERWSNVTEAMGGMYKMVTNGVVEKGLSTERTARSAIGIKADGTVIFYTMDGKQNGYSVGATMTQAAMRLIELGCVEAICLDGGGSTTIGATYPDQNGMTVVNSPSDGAQRANSTALFLTTTLQPVGDVASYYVTPADTMVLSGAMLNLSAKALDSNYYPSAYGNAVYYSMLSGGGAVDESGVFTAGSESGFSVVSVGDGAASGAAYITTVKTPSKISIANEQTGGAVTALALNPKEQVDLKASAAYKNLALVSQDGCYTWALDPAVGTVDQNGVITAGEKSATGNLTVSAGGKSVSVPVSVAGHVKTLETFENGVGSFTSTDTATISAETTLDYVHNGKTSMKFAYNATSGSASAGSTMSIPAGENYLGLWVYGDGSGNTLLATSVDASGAASQTVLTALDFTGWKHLSVALPVGTTGLKSLDIVYGGSGKQSGNLWIDHVTASNETMNDTVPPTVSVSVSGTQMTASVLDNVDRNLPKENVTVTYDGKAISFDWSAVTGVVKATVPAPDSKNHRVTVTATDLSGNIARGSYDVNPKTDRDPVFSDMDDNWAESYASWLYDNGVVNGVSGNSGLLFQPTKNITRAEFFAMAARWMGTDLTQYDSIQLPFADASSVPSWALREVKALYAMGILQGSASNGVVKVNPNATITRAEAMAILGRTQQKGFAEGSLNFSDAAKVPAWAAPYIKTLVAQGVVAGYDNKINPLNPITRAEVAKMLYTMK